MVRSPLEIAIGPPAVPGAAGVRLANVFLPGAGLIRLDCVFSGLLLGLLTWAPLTAAAFVVWLAPGAIVDWQVTALTAVGLLSYVVAQSAVDWRLAQRPRRQQDYRARTEPALAAAYQHLARGDLLAAQLQLDIVLAADREHFEANLVQARLLAMQNKFDRARLAYRRCRALDSAGRWDWELTRELARLPG